MEVDAIYVSVWDDQVELRSACKFNPETKEVSNIEQNDSEVDGQLTDESVEVNGESFNDDDGVTFNY